MATTTKIINGITCISSDWPNVERAKYSCEDEELDKLIQSILHHPLKDFISVPWVFSYFYKTARQEFEPSDAAKSACKAVLNRMNELY